MKELKRKKLVYKERTKETRLLLHLEQGGGYAGLRLSLIVVKLCTENVVFFVCKLYIHKKIFF